MGETKVQPRQSWDGVAISRWIQAIVAKKGSTCRGGGNGGTGRRGRRGNHSPKSLNKSIAKGVESDWRVGRRGQNRRGQTISKKASGKAAEPNLKRQQNGTLHGESRGLLGSKQEENVRGRQGFRKARVRGEGDFRAKGGWGRCLEIGLEGGNEPRIEFMLRSNQVQLGK